MLVLLTAGSKTIRNLRRFQENSSVVLKSLMGGRPDTRTNTRIFAYKIWKAG